MNKPTGFKSALAEANADLFSMWLNECERDLAMKNESLVRPVFILRQISKENSFLAVGRVV